VDIAAVSMGMNQSKLQQDSSLAVMKMAMDTVKGQGEMAVQLLKAQPQQMEQSVQSHIGSNLDIRV
jgi:hypothetical protein